jgi:hypothetical protein
MKRIPGISLPFWSEPAASGIENDWPPIWLQLFFRYSVADPGCFIPDPDPTIAPSRIRPLLTNFVNLSRIQIRPLLHPGSRIRNPVPGGKKAPDPGSGSATLFRYITQIMTTTPSSAVECYSQWRCTCRMTLIKMPNTCKMITVIFRGEVVVSLHISLAFWSRSCGISHTFRRLKITYLRT